MVSAQLLSTYGRVRHCDQPVQRLIAEGEGAQSLSLIGF